MNKIKEFEINYKSYIYLKYSFLTKCENIKYTVVIKLDNLTKTITYLNNEYCF